MYYRRYDDGEIECVSDAEFPGSEYTSEAIEKGYDGVYRFKKDMQTDEYKAAKKVHDDEVEVMTLRNEREWKCFIVVNRGQVWYDTLTEEQKAELTEWYNAWLDVTETRIEPDAPKWLK